MPILPIFQPAFLQAKMFLLVLVVDLKAQVIQSIGMFGLTGTKMEYLTAMSKWPQDHHQVQEL